MIHVINAEPDFPSLSPEEAASLDRDVLAHYPYPLALSYRNCLEAEDPMLWLGVCIKDLFSTLFQYAGPARPTGLRSC